MHFYINEYFKGQESTESMECVKMYEKYINVTEYVGQNGCYKTK